jgi:hypothetical protein
MTKMDRLGLQQQRPFYGIEQQFSHRINTGTGNAREVASPMMGFLFSPRISPSIKKRFIYKPDVGVVVRGNTFDFQFPFSSIFRVPPIGVYKSIPA